MQAVLWIFSTLEGRFASGRRFRFNVLCFEGKLEKNCCTVVECSVSSLTYYLKMAQNYYSFHFLKGETKDYTLLLFRKTLVSL